MADQPTTFEIWTKSIDIGVGVLMPFTILVVGYFLNKRLAKIEDKREQTEALSAARLNCFKALQSELNVIFCASTYVGTWLDTKPDEVLEAKRRADAIFFSSMAIWEADFLDKYKKFMQLCFSTYRGRGQHAVLRADVDKYAEGYGVDWNEEMEAWFVDREERKVWMKDQQTDGKDEISYSQELVVPAYVELIWAAAHSLGIEDTRQKMREALSRPTNKF